MEDPWEAWPWPVLRLGWAQTQTEDRERINTLRLGAGEQWGEAPRSPGAPVCRGPHPSSL